MKTLTLVRHAKSDWDWPDLADHDRPLNKRGLATAPQVGSYLEKRGIKPDKIQPVDDLYLASVSDYQRVIQSIDEVASASHIMIFSHNPGTHAFAHYLTGGNEIDRFITCAAAMIELNIDYWGEIDSGCGRLEQFITPRDLPPV